MADHSSTQKNENVEAVVEMETENTNNNNGGAAAATGGCAACACCLTCMGFFIGIPLIIGGAVLLSPLLAWIPWALGAGIGLIIAGVLMFVGAIIACVMTGCCAAKASQQQQQVAPQQVVVVQHGAAVEPAPAVTQPAQAEAPPKDPDMHEINL